MSGKSFRTIYVYKISEKQQLATLENCLVKAFIMHVSSFLLKHPA